ncbi:hypothetical protein HHK36_023789 [Tetracentron sinense]|uniref:Chlororespiratory reduction 41 n=1 Tax=Tetracentron sinense TaxID=13715 RepID=A0A834YLW3_TETSI|nr:hypothetical protein HHK36_023789 [Tetracentron sinense]
MDWCPLIFVQNYQQKQRALSSCNHFQVMASTALQFPKPLHFIRNQTSVNPSQLRTYHHPLQKHFTIKCTSNSMPQTEFPSPNSDPETDTQPDSFEIEKRRKSEILRDRKSQLGLVKPEPRNFEIGWKRTKEIQVEKPKGYVIADFLEKLDGLMGREYGSTELLAKTGEIVAERAREEAEVLREEGEVDERLITELFRVLRLMEMDLAMVKAAVKEETLSERLEQAKARCRQAILVANSF